MNSPLPATIAQTVTHEVEIKKSRFICTLSPASDIDDANRQIAALRKRFWDARHNCSALILGHHADIRRSSDDGEPSGTAGIPMLEVLIQRELTDVVTVVTRYFGGVKLGAGGLIRAYSGVVSEAVDRAAILDRETRVQLQVAADHAEAGRVAHFLQEWCARTESGFDPPMYGEQALFLVTATEPMAVVLRQELATFSSGRLDAVQIGTLEVAVPRRRDS